jgi:hypothetical protein
VTDYDAVAELADRMLEKYRRGEEPSFEDRLAWDGFTAEERDEFMALSDQQLAHGKEKLEALTENVRVLELLLAHKQGATTAMEFVEQVRGAVRDPLAE